MSNRVLFIPGVPVPQGSKRHVGNGVLVESSRKLRPWRATVTAAISDAGWAQAPLLTGPVAVHLTFGLPRPAYHYGTGRNAGVLRASAPEWHDKRPDVDKLVRAVLDALTESGAVRDDAQVAALAVHKEYAATPGVRIAMGPL